MNQSKMVKVDVLKGTTNGCELTLALFHLFKACYQQGKKIVPVVSAQGPQILVQL